MSLFARIAQLTAEKDDRLHVEIVGLKGGEIRVRMSPDFGPTPSNASNEEAELRALLSTPITITGTPSEVDAALSEHMDNRAPIQASGMDALGALQAKMATATSKAKQATPSAAATGGAGAKPAEKKPTKPAKAPTLADSF